MEKTARYINRLRAIYHSGEELLEAVTQRQVIYFIHYQNGKECEVYFDFELPEPQRIEQPVALGYRHGRAGELVIEDQRCDQFNYHLHLNDKLSNILALHIIKELRNNGHSDRHYLELLAVTSISHLLKTHARHLDNFPAGHQGFSLGKLRRIDTFLEENIDSVITVEDMARVIGFSKGYFSEIFKKTTGLSPYQYLVRFRMEKAREILLTTDDSIIQIALKVGIENQSQFSQLFKRYYSLSPKEMRVLFSYGH